MLSESGAGALTALHRSQELKALHKAGACNKFLEMWISSNGALGVGGDLSTPLLRWQTLVEKLASHDYEDRIRRAILHRHTPDRQVPQGEMQESDQEQPGPGADESVRRVAGGGADDVIDAEAAADEDAVVERMSVLSAQVAELSAAVTLLAAAVGGSGGGGFGGHGGGAGGELAGVARRGLGGGLPGASCVLACASHAGVRNAHARTCPYTCNMLACILASTHVVTHSCMHVCIHSGAGGADEESATDHMRVETEHGDSDMSQASQDMSMMRYVRVGVCVCFDILVHTHTHTQASQDMSMMR